MIGVVLVSHSKKITEGIKEMVMEMAGEESRVLSAGGTDDGRLGTSAPLIMDNINKCSDCDKILIFCDLGSSVLSSEMAIELLDEEMSKKCILVDGPIVEGALVASVQATVTNDVNEILEEVRKIIMVGC